MRANDKKVILEKLENLKIYSLALKEYQMHKKQEIEKNYTLRYAIERALQISIECILDIGEMLISIEGLKKPDKYADVIKRLGEHGIIPQRFSKKLAPAAGFRNILVHHYAELDLNKLYDHLQNDIDDFNTFAKYVVRYLKKK